MTRPNPNELAMDITNNNVAPITIDSFHADWVKVSPSQKLSKLFLTGAEIWNIADNTPPSDIPTEGNWNSANRTILGNGAVDNLVVQFQEPLEPGNYQLLITFDNGCPVTGSFIVP